MEALSDQQANSAGLENGFKKTNKEIVYIVPIFCENCFSIYSIFYHTDSVPLAQMLTQPRLVLIQIN